MRFSKDSFLSEITTKAEARASYQYFTQNMQEFMNELHAKGYTYENVNQIITTLWKNLCGACERVGYTNAHIEDIKKQLHATN